MLAKCSCSIFSNGYGHSHLECCCGTHQSGCYMAEVGPGTKLYRAEHVDMRACLAKRGRGMRTAKQMYFRVCIKWFLCVLVVLHPNIVQLRSHDATWDADSQATQLTFCCSKAQVTFSISHQVTAKSFWQQCGAHIISKGEAHPEHLTPCGQALWETDVGAKWDRPWRGAVFYIIL